MTEGVRPTFPQRGDFFATLRGRVDTYFESNQIKRRDHWRFYAKSLFIIAVYIFTYVQLVFYTETAGWALLWAVLTGQGIALIGFNVMHDAAHGAASNNDRVNKIMARTLDLIGGSVFLWRFKHNVLHHTYPNIESWDEDLDSGGLLRFTPDKPRKPWHRFQHFYAPLLYGILAAYWVFSDFFELMAGKVGGHSVPGITRGEVFTFLLGKGLFLTYALAIPLVYHTWWHVLIGFLVVELVAGLILSMVFQLAHIIEENDFLTIEGDGKLEDEWAVHQLKTTANFAPDNPLVNWYTGGLNHQVEHHLFPKISHVHYQAIGKIVRETCLEFDIPYREHRTVASAVRSHMRLLKTLGQSTPAAAPA